MLEIAFFLIVGPALVLLVFAAAGLFLPPLAGALLFYLLGLSPVLGFFLGLLYPLLWALWEAWIVPARKGRATHP